jgi:hypothetical protein
LKALVRLHSKGYELNNECYKQAIGLFQDCFEPVRIAAIQLVSTWMMTRQTFEDEMSSNQTNEAFLQVKFYLLSMIQPVILLLSVLFQCVVYCNVLMLCKCCRFAPRPQT